jgi:hypothetical protein
VNTLAKPPQLILPESFRAADYLPFRMRRLHPAAEWFVSTILMKLARQRGMECLRLHAPYLRRMMGDRYRAIVKALIEGGAVTRKPYKRGVSFGYTLAECFATDRHVRLPVTNAVMLERIQRQRDRAIQRASDTYLPVHRALFNHQTRLRIAGDGARKCLAGLPERCNKFDSQGILIRDIEERRWRLSVGRWGRVQNNISSLKKELREHLRIEGEPPAEIDLVAAQPTLLALLIQINHNSSQFTKTPKHREGSCWPSSLRLPRRVVAEIGGDFALYRRAVLTGDVYSLLADASGIERAAAKHKFLVDLLAKRGAYRSDFEDVFRRKYPSVHTFIRAVNHNHHARLIRLLQRLESWIVIEQVCGELGGTPVVTLHDAVFVAPWNLPTVERAFSTVLANLDFEMRWRVAA